MKSQKILLSLLFCLVLSSLLSGCTDGFKAISKSSSLGSESLNDGIVNQAAKINCDLFLNSSTSPYRRISTISSTDTFTENAKEGDIVSFDCSKTEDEDSVDKLAFSIDMNYTPSAPNFVSLAGKSFSLSATQVGRFPMALKVVDTGGKERIKTFTLVVECVEAQAPVLDVSKINITPSSKLNFFNYSVGAGAVTGGSDFQFAWDFNGDYVFDSVSLTDPNNIWTPNPTLNNIYSPFVTEASASRQISIRVKNNCEKESSYTFAAHFPGDNIARNASSQATVKPYFYLQSDITGVSSADLVDQRKNADLLVTQYPEDAALKRIECDYKKTRIDSPAVFTMKAYNRYKTGSDFQHGMEIQINNINDDLSTGTQEISGAVLQSAKYRASAADDGIISELYDKKTACTLTMRIIRQVSVTPCADDKKDQADYMEAQAITILGEYSCPTLTDAVTAKSVKADNGKFFCQVASGNQCVGGGGGGGGAPPPEQ